jgi:hypothetical protein
MTLFIRFLFFVAHLCDGWATRLSARRKRLAGSKPCPTCFGPSALIAEVEQEEDAPARLWECARCGCFDDDGKNVGKRRTCKKCGHKEGPANDASCHCKVNVPFPCCYSAKRTAEERAAFPADRSFWGLCEYDDPHPGLDWNPRIPVSFEHR